MTAHHGAGGQGQQARILLQHDCSSELFSRVFVHLFALLWFFYSALWVFSIEYETTPPYPSLKAPTKEFPITNPQGLWEAQMGTQSDSCHLQQQRESKVDWARGPAVLWQNRARGSHMIGINTLWWDASLAPFILSINLAIRFNIY